MHLYYMHILSIYIVYAYTIIYTYTICHILYISIYYTTIYMPAPWKKNNDQPSQHIKKQRCYFAKKALSSQSYGFPSSQVWI